MRISILTIAELMQIFAARNLLCVQIVQKRVAIVEVILKCKFNFPYNTELCPLLSHAITNLSVLACLDVNHINDNPGYFTCDCVDSNNPCLADGVCVVEERCPKSDGKSTGIHVQ